MPGVLHLGSTGLGEVKNNIKNSWRTLPDGSFEIPDLKKRCEQSSRDVGSILLVMFGVIAMFAGTITAFL
jgi:hypothetical protein